MATNKNFTMKQFNGNDYDTLFPETLGEQVIPSSSVLSLFNLPQNSKVDDVLSWIGKYNTHCWRRRTAEFDAEEVKTDITSEVSIVNMENRPIQYSQSVSINALTGEISLVNPQTITVNGGSTYADQLKALAPCYIKNASEAPTAVYYMPTGANSGASSSYTIHYTSSNLRFGNAATSSIRAKRVTADITVTYGEWELLFSTNRSAYPDSGVVDGYEYEYLGVPFDKLPTAPRIEIVSYVGTGTYGQSNACSVTFSFAPKLALMLCQKSNGQGTMIFGVHRTTVSNNDVTAMAADALGTSYPSTVGGMLGFTNRVRSDSGYSYGKKSSDGKTFSWYYEDSAPIMFNNSGTTYYVLGIG